MFSITKSFSFAAAHHLPRLPDGHKCRRPHGHNYEVIIEVAAETLDDRGFVIDYGDLARLNDWLRDTFDHQDLNVVPWPYRNSASAENLASFIATTAGAMGYNWESVTVKETPATSATIRKNR